MSRYALVARSGLPKTTTVAIGWDGPLQTFFVTVRERPAGPLTLWVGTATREITAVDDALSWVAPWAEVPADLQSMLAKDQAGDQRPGRHPFALA